jgi:hypothetical protein
VLWGVTRGHQGWQSDLTSPRTAANADAPQPLAIGDLADLEPASSEPTRAAVSARVDKSAKTKEYALFDGVGSDSAPKDVKSPPAPVAKPAAASDSKNKKSQPVVASDSESSVPVESPKIPDIQPDGFNGGFVPPPPPQPKPSPADPASQGMAERFKQWDKNGDGKLTKDEVPSERLFKAMDKNGDGTATPEEIEAFTAEAQKWKEQNRGDGQGRRGRGDGQGGGRDGGQQ